MMANRGIAADVSGTWSGGSKVAGGPNVGLAAALDDGSTGSALSLGR